MSNVPQYLIEEARNRGIVEGATARSPYGSEFIVGPVSGWRTNFDGTGAANHDGYQIYSHDMQQWATVITPAPAQAGGLKEGDAVECGPAMRAAIIELAKELDVLTYQHGGGQIDGLRYSCGQVLTAGMLRTWAERNGGKGLTIITPEAFIAKMRVTASQPKPITIDGHNVKWEKGCIKVGCQTITNDTVRAIAAKLIDP